MDFTGFQKGEIWDILNGIGAPDGTRNSCRGLLMRIHKKVKLVLSRHRHALHPQPPTPPQPPPPINTYDTRPPLQSLAHQKPSHQTTRTNSRRPSLQSKPKGKSKRKRKGRGRRRSTSSDDDGSSSSTRHSSPESTPEDVKSRRARNDRVARRSAQNAAARSKASSPSPDPTPEPTFNDDDIERGKQV